MHVSIYPLDRERGLEFSNPGDLLVRRVFDTNKPMGVGGNENSVVKKRM